MSLRLPSWDDVIARWGNPAVFHIIRKENDVGYVRFLYPGPIVSVRRRARLADDNGVHVVVIWLGKGQPPWPGDPNFAPDLFYDQEEISGLLQEISRQVFSVENIQFKLVPVIGATEKRKVITEIFDENQLIGMEGTIGL